MLYNGDVPKNREKAQMWLQRVASQNEDPELLQMSLLMIAGVLLILSQMISHIRQILFIKIQKNLDGRIQAKVLNSSMESLGKSGQGAVTAYYTSDVGRIDSFANRIRGAFPDLPTFATSCPRRYGYPLHFCIDESKDM